MELHSDDVAPSDGRRPWEGGAVGRAAAAGSVSRGPSRTEGGDCEERPGRGGRHGEWSHGRVSPVRRSRGLSWALEIALRKQNRLEDTGVCG